MAARAAHRAGFAPEVEFAATGVMVSRFLDARAWGEADLRADPGRAGPDVDWAGTDSRRGAYTEAGCIADARTMSIRSSTWPALPCLAHASVQGLGITKDLVVELSLSGRRGAAAAPREWNPRVDVDRAAPREARRGVSPPAGRVSIVIRDISGTWRQRRSPFGLVWGLCGVDRGEVLRERHVERYGPRSLGPCPTPDGRGQSHQDETRSHDRWTPDPRLRMGQRFGGMTPTEADCSKAMSAPI